MAIRAFVFDMDGTLLHSLPDLVVAANEAFSRLGFPIRSYEEYLALMGNGAERLIYQAAPHNATDGQRKQAFELWRSLYLQSDYAQTVPFPGIVDALVGLRDRGVKTAILSNKFDAGVQVLAERFFPGLFDVARGEMPPTPRKPDPTSLLQVLEAMEVQPAEAAYVGDTAVDVKVARNAGVKAIGVSWGYDKANPLPRDLLDAYLNEPSELLAL